MPATYDSDKLITQIAEAIIECDSDYRFGKPGQADFVREGLRVMGQPTGAMDILGEQIADEMYEDSGVNLATERQMAAYIYSRVTGADPGTALRFAAPWTGS